MKECISIVWLNKQLGSTNRKLFLFDLTTEVFFPLFFFCLNLISFVLLVLNVNVFIKKHQKNNVIRSTRPTLHANSLTPTSLTRPRTLKVKAIPAECDDQF